MLFTTDVMFIVALHTAPYDETSDNNSCLLITISLMLHGRKLSSGNETCVYICTSSLLMPCNQMHNCDYQQRYKAYYILLICLCICLFLFVHLISKGVMELAKKKTKKKTATKKQQFHAHLLD